MNFLGPGTVRKPYEAHRRAMRWMKPLPADANVRYRVRCFRVGCDWTRDEDSMPRAKETANAHNSRAHGGQAVAFIETVLR